MTSTSFAPTVCFRTLLGFVAIAGLSTATHVTVAAQTGTPTEFYVSYRAAFEKAQKIEELLPFLAAKNRQEVEKTPADERVSLGLESWGLS